MLRTALISSPIAAAQTAVLGSTIVLSAPFTRALQEPCRRLWARALMATCGVELSVEGAQRLEPSQRYVFVSNHQSYLDVPCLIHGLPNPIRFIAKRELFKVPIFGQAMRALGEIDVNRKDPADARRKLMQAQVGVAQAFSLLFFAEGHRSLDGRLLPFKRGAVLMALRLGVPLVPLAISGTNRILKPGWNALRPGPAKLEIGDPIPTGADTLAESERLQETVRGQIAAMLARGLA